jgi:hypothetical protein
MKAMQPRIAEQLRMGYAISIWKQKTRDINAEVGDMVQVQVHAQVRGKTMYGVCG